MMYCSLLVLTKLHCWVHAPTLVFLQNASNWLWRADFVELSSEVLLLYFIFEVA